VTGTRGDRGKVKTGVGGTKKHIPRTWTVAPRWASEGAGQKASIRLETSGKDDGGKKEKVKKAKREGRNMNEHHCRLRPRGEGRKNSFHKPNKRQKKRRNKKSRANCNRAAPRTQTQRGKEKGKGKTGGKSLIQLVGT